ncbi:MAG: HypC/HybG/HupF family hydrogenase formation chaperone [Candidatus Moranbacteria bacterium]|nr:HypC/HybG/HupF family hydrogenase formation chaperone [Candidatus Moranbacteria bacterium]
MCLAFPGRIVSVDGAQAEVDFDGVKKSVNVSLLEKPKKGEYVIVHAGFAIEKVDEKRKNEIEKIMNEEI